MAYFITSDLHLNHKKICGPDGFVETRRHFKDVDEMNEYLIEIHNKYVGKNDVTYNLGDISMLSKNPKELIGMLNRMNGAIVIVKGNHDNRRFLKALMANNYRLPNGKDKFTVHEVGLTIKQKGVTYYLTHYPLDVGHMRNNLRSIHGHIHAYPSPLPNGINIGIDSPELPVGTEFGQPLLLNDVIKQLELKHRNHISTPEKHDERPLKGQLSFDI